MVDDVDVEVNVSHAPLLSLWLLAGFWLVVGEAAGARCRLPGYGLACH